MIVLVSCSKAKYEKGKACYVYSKSALFKKISSYVEDNYEHWYILSSKYKLLFPDTYIESYNETLNNKSEKEKQEWSIDIIKTLSKFHCLKNESVIIYAGNEYRKYLIPLLNEQKSIVFVPLKHMGIGEQLRYFKDRGY